MADPQAQLPVAADTGAKAVEPSSTADLPTAHVAASTAIEPLAPQPLNAGEAPSVDAVGASQPQLGESAKEEKSLFATFEQQQSSDATKEKGSAATPLAKLSARLPSIIEAAQHSEMWAIDLKDETHVPTSIVLEKFLRANDHDLEAAEKQLMEALKWRRKMDPLKLLAEGRFDAKRFGSLGYVTTYPSADGKKEIITWNIYGAVKDLKETFGNVEE
jgi:hypothetical protein